MPLEIKADYARPEDSKFVRNSIVNTKSDLITITEDKLENILLKHERVFALRKAWVAPLSLLLTAGGAILTAEFTDAIGLKAATWRAMFVLIGIGTAMWLLYSLGKLLFYRKTCSIDHLITTIKSVPQQSSDDVPPSPRYTYSVSRKKPLS